MQLRSLWHLGGRTYFVLDYGLLCAAVACAFKLSPYNYREVIVGPFFGPELRLVGYGLPLLMAIGLHLAGLQSTRAGFHGSAAFTQAAVGIAGGMAVFLVVHALIEFELVGRYIVLLSFIYSLGFVLGSRVLLWNLADQQSRRVLIYGDARAVGVIEVEVRRRRLPIVVLGATTLDKLVPGNPEELAEIRRIGLYAHASRVGADEMVVDLHQTATQQERDALLFCTNMGLRVTALSYFCEREFEKVDVDGLSEAWFWGYDPAHSRPVFFAFKRIMDIAISLTGILLFSPFAPFVALVIWAQDRGPVIYSQIRIGLNNKPFRIFKFRTMRMNAEVGGAKWATEKDPRVTWFGRMMRKTRIDEVPQFWNILLGDMSFVGPRPERPEFIEKIEQQVPFFRYRHLVKPGLTGWAQINYPYGASIEDARQKLSYDFYYLKYGSITRELHIVLRTVVAMVQGAR